MTRGTKMAAVTPRSTTTVRIGNTIHGQILRFRTGGAVQGTCAQPPAGAVWSVQTFPSHHRSCVASTGFGYHPGCCCIGESVLPLRGSHVGERDGASPQGFVCETHAAAVTL